MAKTVPEDNYIRRCTVIKIVDGDTLHLSVDLGYDFRDLRMTVRLAGINTPETPTLAGKEAKAMVGQWIADAKGLTVATVRDSREKYGRFLATIYRTGDPISLNQWLLNTGHAVAYDGGAR